MQHSFSAELAQEYGLLEAVIINHLAYWVEHNRANGKSYYDGAHWTFNSISAFAEIFPYATENQLRRAIKKLKDEGVIRTGVFNKVAYDRTTWYTFTADFIESHPFIWQKTQIEVCKNTNRSVQKHKPIPISKQDNKQNNKVSVETQSVYDRFIEGFEKNPNQCKLTDKRRKLIERRLKDCGQEMVEQAIDKVASDPFYRGENDRGWTATLEFILKSYEQVERLSQLQPRKPKESETDDFDWSAKLIANENRRGY